MATDALLASNWIAPQCGHSRAIAEISASQEWHGIVAVIGD